MTRDDLSQDVVDALCDMLIAVVEDGDEIHASQMDDGPLIHVCGSRSLVIRRLEVGTPGVLTQEEILSFTYHVAQDESASRKDRVDALRVVADRVLDPHRRSP